MMINPMQMILNQFMNNPQIQNNPMAKNVMDMYRKGDMDGLRNMANNMAKERNTTVDEIKSNLMRQFGMK